MEHGLKLLAIEYINARSKYKAECIQCGATIDTYMTNVLHHNAGCTFCGLNRNEKIMMGCLNTLYPNLNVGKIKIECTDITIQKTFYCDAGFKINEMELIFEYQGIQHYQPVRFSYSVTKEQADRQFEKQTKRDAWLRIFCTENNIILIEVDSRLYKEEKIKPFLLLKLKEFNIPINEEP